MMAVSTISYIDRSALAVLIPSIQRDTGMTTEQYGWIVAGFSWAYMLGNPLWGRWLDRFGVRLGMLASVAIWTLASASHAWAASVATFFAARAVLGFGEGATFPGALRTVMQTLPRDRRSRGIALSYSGGSFGAIITPFVVTPVYAAYGWQAAFLATGAIGLLWLVFWASISRGRPELGPVAESESTAVGISFRDARIWAYIAMYAFGNVPLGLVLYTTSIYLTKVFQLRQTELAAYLWIPPLGWELGYFFWGWILDRMLARSADSRPVFRTVFLIGIALLFPFSGAWLAPTAPALIALYFATLFSTGAFIIPAVAYATSVFGSKQSGLIAGLGAGSFSAVQALLMPWFGRMFDQQAYSLAFGIAASLPAIGLAIWWIASQPPRLRKT